MSKMRKRMTLLAIGLVIAATAVMAQMKSKTATAQVSTPPPAPVMTPQAEPSLESARRIPRDEAMKMVKEGKAIYVDVRPKEAYDAGHIKGAINIPEFEIINRLKEIPPGKFIITYCA